MPHRQLRQRLTHQPKPLHRHLQQRLLKLRPLPPLKRWCHRQNQPLQKRPLLCLQ
jgi:hypothetical protein